MNLDQRLEVQLAALDRMELDIFLVPAETQELAGLRKLVVASALLAAWSNRISNAGEEVFRESCSEVIRSEAESESKAAKMARARELAWGATEEGQPLSWDLFMLVPGIPWLDIIRAVVAQHIE
jgi:hypothetical protein